MSKKGKSQNVTIIEPDPPILFKRYIWGRERHFHNHASKLRFYYLDNDDDPHNHDNRSQTPFLYRGNRLYPLPPNLRPESNGGMSPWLPIADNQSNANTSSPRQPVKKLKPRNKSEKDKVSDDKDDDPDKENKAKKEKPKIVTFIKAGSEKPHDYFKMLLNQNSPISYEDLLQEISDAFQYSSDGTPDDEIEKSPIKKLFNMYGKKLDDIKDLFRAAKDHIFVAVPDILEDKILPENDIKRIIAETFPDYLIEEESDENTSEPETLTTRGDSETTNNDQKKKAPLKNKNNNNNEKRKPINKTPPIKKTNPKECNDTKQPSDRTNPKVSSNPTKPPPSGIYPFNDSRKPGAFDMLPEHHSEEITTANERANILGLERMRAALEEREKARQAMLQKLSKQPNAPNSKLANQNPQNSKMANQKRQSNKPTKNDNKPDKKPNKDFSNSPYLKSLQLEESNSPRKKQPPYTERGKNNKENEEDNGRLSKANRYPISDRRNYPDNNRRQGNNPNQENNSQRKPRGKATGEDNGGKNSNPIQRSKQTQKPSDKSTPDSDDENDKSQWERIPPLNLNYKPKPRQNQYRPPSNVDIAELPVLKEDESLVTQSPWKDENKQKPKIKLKKQQDPTPKEAASPNKVRHKYSEVLGPRGDTVNMSNNKDANNSLTKPTRTSKQSTAISNPVHKASRIVPNHAKQLDKDSNIDDIYKIGDLIGSGNFADVKQAQDKNNGNKYALKIIDKPKLKDKEDLVEEEIRILKSCDHPNIMKLHDEYESPNKVYLVQELVPGGDLFDLICEQIKFSEAQSAYMLRDIVRGIFYLHSRNIVHRDIKPENILYFKNNNLINLKLADFGLASEVDNPLYIICGTPTYVAPEILREKGYGLEVDIWAAGIICYILLCGFPPFRSPDRNQTELFEFIKACEFEYLKPYWNGISNDAKDLINHMLNGDPTKRYKAIDVLCHPWILSLGNSIKFSSSIDEVRDQARVELHMEVTMFKKQYIRPR